MPIGTQNLRVYETNKVRILLGGKNVGLAQNARFTDDYAPMQASGIGNILVQEYVPTVARYSVSVSEMMLKASSLRSLGIIPENGAQALLGYEFDIEIYYIEGDVSTSAAFQGFDAAGSVNTTSTNTGILLCTYKYCSYASGELSVDKHAIMANSALFNCRERAGTAV